MQVYTLQAILNNEIYVGAMITVTEQSWQDGAINNHNKREKNTMKNISEELENICDKMELIKDIGQTTTTQKAH